MAGEEQDKQEEIGRQGDEAEMMARLEEEIRRLPVAEHLVYMLHSLSALAAGRLGLTPDSVVMKDPAQARLAIDAFKALCGVLEPVRSSQEMAGHRGMLAQLQLAYASAVNAEPAPADAGVAETPPMGETPPETGAPPPGEAASERAPQPATQAASDGAQAEAEAAPEVSKQGKPQAASKVSKDAKPKAAPKPRKPRKTGPKDPE